MKHLRLLFLPFCLYLSGAIFTQAFAQSNLPIGSASYLTLEEAVGAIPVEASAGIDSMAIKFNSTRNASFTRSAAAKSSDSRLAFGHDHINGYVSFDLDNPTDQTALSGSAWNTYGGDCVNGILYTYDEDGNFRLYESATGTLIKQIDDAWDEFMSGMAYDYSTGTMYGVKRLDLFTIDMATGVPTKVADITGIATEFLLTLAIDLDGNMYGIEVNINTNSNFYSINKTTGVCTVIGNTGVRVNYAQSMNFDHNDGTLYWCHCFNLSNAGFRTIDVATGATTLIADWNKEITSFHVEFEVEEEVITPPFVAVTDITDVPETTIAGKALELTATVNPADATNQDIVWTVKDDGGINAKVTGSDFYADKVGKAVVTATITGGIAEGEDYTQDFEIEVNKPEVTKTEYINTEKPTIFFGTINCGSEQFNYSYNITDGTVSLNGGEFKPMDDVLEINWTDIKAVAKHYFPGISIMREDFYDLSQLISHEPTYELVISFEYKDGKITEKEIFIETIVTELINDSRSELFGELPVKSIYYNISIETSTGGAVHADTYTSMKKETVTLNIRPDEDYELMKIVVHQKDDTKVGLTLSGSGDVRTFIMPDFDVVVAVHFKYAGVTTGIDKTSQAKALKAWVQDGILHIDGLTAGKAWSVHSITGLLIHQSIAGNDKAEISLPARGVYIVKSGKETLKVMN